MKAMPQYALERHYGAPAEVVWRAWTDPAIFARWYGPGVETIVHKMDVCPGGEAWIEMKWSSNRLLQKFQYAEVAPCTKLGWVFTSTDEHWQSIPSPVIAQWPERLITTIKLESLGADKCMLHLGWTPLAATPAEVERFVASRLDMDAAWNAAFKALDEVVQGLMEGTIP